MSDGMSQVSTRQQTGRSAPAVTRSREFSKRGVSREAVRRLTARGLLERAARGVYLGPKASRSPHRDLLIVATRVPNGVFCLLSALAFHGLTSEMPHEVWLAVGLKARTPAADTPPIRLVRLSESPLTDGVEVHVEHGVSLRVFSAAKTVADCFKFRSKVGLDVAVAALRQGWAQKRFTMDEVWQFARIDRVAEVMRPYLEVLVG
jgi:predicted transcriptional regulator of viral defense system